MKSRLSYRWAAVLLAHIAVLSAPVAADPPNLIPITAEQAFDAVTLGVDPVDGWPADVTLIDLRDPVEIFFSGAPGRVDTISLSDGREITPDDGKVRLLHEGKFVEYRLAGRYQRLQVAKIGSLSISQLAVNIPYLFRTDTEWAPNDQFADAVEALIEEEAPYQVVILFCRTGGRSSSAALALDSTWFDAVYEIDDPAGGAILAASPDRITRRPITGTSAFQAVKPRSRSIPRCRGWIRVYRLLRRPSPTSRKRAKSRTDGGRCSVCPPCCDISLLCSPSGAGVGGARRPV